MRGVTIFLFRLDKITKMRRQYMHVPLYINHKVSPLAFHDETNDTRTSIHSSQTHKSKSVGDCAKTSYPVSHALLNKQLSKHQQKTWWYKFQKFPIEKDVSANYFIIVNSDFPESFCNLNFNCFIFSLPSGGVKNLLQSS